MFSASKAPAWPGFGNVAHLFAALAIASVAVGCIDERSTQSPAGAQQLESLPYLTWVAAEGSMDKRGVVRNDPTRTAPGLNLFSPRHRSQAVLMDLKGTTVHTWSAAVDKSDTWQVVEMLPGGELLAVVVDRRLVKVARDSRVVWTLELPFHHDIHVAADGTIFSLLRQERTVEGLGSTLNILDDLIAVVSSDGRLLKTISLFDLFGHRISQSRWERVANWWANPEKIEQVERRRRQGRFPLPHGSPVDVFHTNAVQLIPRDVDGLCRAGALLVSLRELDLIAILDPEAPAVLWTWGSGVLGRQHHPTLLDNNHILLFDNKGAGKGVSRVLEIDPVVGKIVWEYRATPPDTFYSSLRGSSQRLLNGNTLITESDSGRVFEVTPDGEVVWEYFVPFLKKKDRARAAVYRMTRLPPASEKLAWLNRATLTSSR